MALSGGMIGGILGGVLGVLGGAVGSYMAIKNARPGPPKKFMIRVTIVFWLVCAAFLAGFLLIPSPWNFLLSIPYGLALSLGIPYTNRKLNHLTQG